MQCHATTGLSTATYLKAIEAGIDNVDTAVSSMSMTYGHSPTESLVATLQGTDRDTGLDITLIEEIAAYFREVRKKYAKFEGSLRGVDSRILVAQVPGGMLTNLENQLREQNASEKVDEVLEEIPRVREDLGMLPLVTPTSQIVGVGSQAVINVLSGARYATISNETAGVLKGEYGATPLPVNAELQAKVLEGADPITCRPADLLEPELEIQTTELQRIAKEKGIRLADAVVDDVLTYALFPQIGTTGVYSVRVNGKSFTVEVAENGQLGAVAAAPAAPAAAAGSGDPVNAVLAGNIFKVHVSPGMTVAEGDPLLVVEAMKMETVISSPKSGTVTEVMVREGDAVAVGDTLVLIA
jgi:oxaloacetate decarboxylase alpha subunit